MKAVGRRQKQLNIVALTARNVTKFGVHMRSYYINLHAKNCCRIKTFNHIQPRSDESRIPAHPYIISNTPHLDVINSYYNTGYIIFYNLKLYKKE